MATLCAEGLDLVKRVTQFNDPVDVSYEGVRPICMYLTTSYSTYIGRSKIFFQIPGIFYNYPSYLQHFLRLGTYASTYVSTVLGDCKNTQSESGDFQLPKSVWIHQRYASFHRRWVPVLLAVFSVGRLPVKTPPG